MANKILSTDPEDQPKPRQAFADDVVGRFRSGHQMNGLPAALEAWRVTTDDPEVATAIHGLLGGDEPQEWDAKGGDVHEVFTAAESVEVILAGPSAVRERMVLWGRNGKLILAGDGESGMGPQIEVYFTLVEQPNLGIFEFRSGSWPLARSLAADRLVDQLEQIGGPVRATLVLEHVKFTAKSGKRAGQLVSFTRPRLRIVGPAETGAWLASTRATGCFSTPPPTRFK